MTSAFRHKYNPNVQAMRGLSILLVLSYHYFEWPRQAGALGVGLFFCISGYLITSILLDEFYGAGRIDFRAFYIRRARRLLPLALVVLSVTLVTFLILDTLGAISIDKRGLVLSTLFSIFYAGNLLGYFHLGYNDLAAPVSHFWSLGVEEQFYFIWPITLFYILRQLKRVNSSILMYGLILFSTSLHFVFQVLGKTVWTLPTSYFDILFSGCLIAILQFQHGFRLTRGVSMAFLLPASCALGFIFFSHVEITDFHGFGYTILFIAEFSLFMTLLGLPFFGRLYFLKWVGDLSYSLYCIHLPILILLNYLIPGSLLRIPTAIVSTFVISYVSRNYFEVLFWRSRFSKQVK